MDSTPLSLIFIVTLGLSYFFALSGLGAAGLLVPIFHWFGFPINAAKSAALLANTVSLSAATFDNFRSKRIDVKLGVPIIVFSVLFAPLGAYVSTYIEKDLIMGLFAAFLVFAGINALIPREAQDKFDQDRHPNISYLSVIGAFAGFLSGLLGIGGGGVIAASMLWMGCNAKKITVITALAVPFSSFSGFIAYAMGGHMSWPILATIGVAALLGGYAGNKTMHSVLPDKFIKYTIAFVSVLFAVKIVFDLAR